MCGISGFFSRTGAPAPVDLVSSMNDSQAHRGPDDGDIWSDGEICLAHRRLSILDPHPRGRQPMSMPEGVTITYNGEIYNFQELREELIKKGHSFQTNTDTEVVLKSYLEWGKDCIQRFVGMFAFALWDKRDRSLLLARDPIGIKPLHYALDDDRVVFASEVQALLKTGAVEAKLDYRGFLDVLTFAADIDPHTCIHGVNGVQPGEAIHISADRVNRWKYWTTNTGFGDSDAAFEIRGGAMETVRKTMVSDVPIGVFLSAGVDSNIIAYSVAQMSKENTNGYIMSFPVANFDEAPEAIKAANEYGIRPIVEDMPKHGFADLVENVMAHSGEITPNPSFVATWHLAERASNDIKVILSGDGPDELLAGYPTYPASLLASAMHPVVPKSALRRLTKWLDGQPVGFRKNDWRERLQRFVYGLQRNSPDRHGIWRIIVRPEMFGDLLSDHVAEKMLGGPDPIAESYGKTFAEQKGNSLLQKLCMTDTGVYLPNDGLVKMDRVGMAHGLEVRVPFLNHDFVQDMLARPDRDRMKLTGWPMPKLQQKAGLKRAFSGDLPGNIISGKKRGFNAPAGEWINGGAKELVDDLLTQEELTRQGIFNPMAIANLLKEHRSKYKDNSHALWLVLATTIWARRYDVRLA